MADRRCGRTPGTYVDGEDAMGTFGCNEQVHRRRNSAPKRCRPCAELLERRLLFVNGALDAVVGAGNVRAAGGAASAALSGRHNGGHGGSITITTGANVDIGDGSDGILSTSMT